MLDTSFKAVSSIIYFYWLRQTKAYKLTQVPTSMKRERRPTFSARSIKISSINVPVNISFCVYAPLQKLKIIFLCFIKPGYGCSPALPPPPPFQDRQGKQQKTVMHTEGPHKVQTCRMQIARAVKR